MSYWKRWTAAFASRIDTVVARVENHEALVDAALRDLRDGTAKAHVRLDRVRKDRRILQSEIDSAQRAAVQWRERAKSTPEDAKAVECLRRSRQWQKRAVDLTSRLEEHERIEVDLTKDLAQLRDRVGQLRNQRDLLRARESRAEALRIASEAGACASGELEELFERWEVRIRECEYAGGRVEPVDTLEQTFESEEETRALETELAALRGEP